MRELNDDLYQRFNGFKSVKRGNKKQGQSDWYYLDPRYNDNEDPRGEISVIAENSPNPQLNAILASDIRKNPDNYYVWRTKGDNKVRDRHRQRDGVIFNWHIPPEGGHPGEDHNCRCRAEPFNPDKHLLNKLVVDVSGLDLFKELAKDLKPIDFNISGLPQYAVNDKANVTRDVGDNRYDNSVLTEEKFRDIINFLRSPGIEGFANFPYLDSVGKDTVCTGHLITEKEMYSLPYYMADTGKPATKNEIKIELDKLHGYTEYQKNAKGKDILRHTFFEHVTKLRLTDEQCDKIDRKIIEAKWNELVEKFPNFTIMDWNLQRAIFDVHYQCDVLHKKDKKDIDWGSQDEFKEYKWPKLLNAAKNKSISQMAENVHVIQSSIERNNAKINWVLNGRFYH